MVAAKLLGHDYIGIEISKEYVDFAETRILNCVNEKKEVLSEMAKHVVTRTFSERKENGEYTGRFKYTKDSPNIEQMPLRLFEKRTNYQGRTPKKLSRNNQADPTGD